MKIRNRKIIKLAAWLAAQPFVWLSRVVSIEVVCESPGTDISDPEATQQFIYCLWHDQILFPLLRCAQVNWLLKTRRVVALVSQHQDGSILTDFMEQFRVHSIRGSSSRGGSRAMRQLIQEAEGSSVFITPDGPRGPRRHVKQGILFLSSQTSRPILPLGVACSSHWDFQGNWTNLIVPRPLSRIVIYAGSPISVPEDASRETLDAFQTQVESAMVQAEQAAKGRLSLLLGKSLDDQPTDQRRAA